MDDLNRYITRHIVEKELLTEGYKTNTLNLLDSMEKDINNLRRKFESNKKNFDAPMVDIELAEVQKGFDRLLEALYNLGDAYEMHSEPMKW